MRVKNYQTIFVYLLIKILEISNILSLSRKKIAEAKITKISCFHTLLLIFFLIFLVNLLFYLTTVTTRIYFINK